MRAPQSRAGKLSSGQKMHEGAALRFQLWVSLRSSGGMRTLTELFQRVLRNGSKWDCHAGSERHFRRKGFRPFDLLDVLRRSSRRHSGTAVLDCGQHWQSLKKIWQIRARLHLCLVRRSIDLSALVGSPKAAHHRNAGIDFSVAGDYPVFWTIETLV